MSAREGLEQGAASIKVELTDGGVNVYHGEDGTLLAALPEAPAGTWDAIWTTFERLGIKRPA